MRPAYWGVIVVVVLIALILIINALIQPGVAWGPKIQAPALAETELPDLGGCDLSGQSTSTDNLDRCEAAARRLLNTASVQSAADPEVARVREQITEVLRQLETLQP